MNFSWLLMRWGVLLLCLSAIQAANAITMEFVEIGDPGNPPNMILKAGDGSQGYGAVAYEYRMSKYETTNAQYAEFLNAVAKTDTHGLYDTTMSAAVYGGITRAGVVGSYTYSVTPNMGNKPVAQVSWYDAARFANWMHNGQPTGMQDTTTTEAGAYTFGGTEIISGRNETARYFLPNEHEWEKAAYYEAGATTILGNGWWRKTSGIDVLPIPATADEFGNISNPGPTVVNFQMGANWNGSIKGNFTTVGSAGNTSPYGVADMSGNAFEWVLADPTKPDPNGWGPYTVRGGSFLQDGHADIAERNLVHHHNHNIVAVNVGFRLAAAALETVPADFNSDGFVDGADLAIWQTSYGLDDNGDANGDGASDGKDFLVWQRNYTGENLVLAAQSVAAVPEPSAFAVAAVGLVALLARW